MRMNHDESAEFLDAAAAAAFASATLLRAPEGSEEWSLWAKEVAENYPMDSQAMNSLTQYGISGDADTSQLS